MPRCEEEHEPREKCYSPHQVSVPLKVKLKEAKCSAVDKEATEFGQIEKELQFAGMVALEGR